MFVKSVAPIKLQFDQTFWCLLFCQSILDADFRHILDKSYGFVKLGDEYCDLWC